MITIENCSKSQEKIIAQAADFYKAWLIPARARRWTRSGRRARCQLELQINFVRGFWIKSGNMAVLDADNTALTKFSITIDSGISLAKKLMVLAHEMTHVRQYIQQDMRISPHGIGWTIWKGELFEDAVTDYFNSPWEIEAFGREYGMFIRFTEAFGYAKRKWTQID